MPRYLKVIWKNSSAGRVLSVLLVVLFVLASTGCMTDPGHGETVPSVDSQVQFGGSLEYPDRYVQVLAQPLDYVNPLVWRQVGSKNSSTTSITWDGRQWYTWSVKAVVPRSYWRHGYTGGKVTVKSRYLGDLGYQDIYTTVPDFWGCWSAQQDVYGVVNNCLSGNQYEADLTTSDFCEGPVVPWLEGVNGPPYFYQPTFWFNEGDDEIQIGEVRGSPTLVRVGGATCTPWQSNPNFFTCPLIGTNGVFEDLDCAKAWLENPEPGFGDLGHALNWSINYTQAFGPSGASCRQKNFAKRGVMRWQGVVSMRDYVEEQMFMEEDLDGDGIPNGSDACISSPETLNGFEDHDGCPDQPPPPACAAGLPKFVCGVGGAAPAGTVVVGLGYLGSCSGSGINAKQVSDYTKVCSGQTMQVCNGYAGPPGWPVIEDNIPSVACSNTPGGFGYARRVQKP